MPASSPARSSCLPAELPVTILPPLPVGKSDEHHGFPGTLTLSAETLGRLWIEIGELVARAGVRKLVLFNSHGGQPQVMEIVARDLRVRLGMLVVAYSWYAAGVPPGLFPDEEVRHGIHAGAIETSMSSHLPPDLVQTAAEIVPCGRMADESSLLSRRPRRSPAAQDLIGAADVRWRRAASGRPASAVDLLRRAARADPGTG